jgi:GWxTD domain-containing protein
MKTTRIALTAVTLACLAVSASAAPAAPPSPFDFPNGPAQWLMTKQEKAAWRNVKTVEEAQRSIDLFWARRDPTRGTPRNEFHAQFDQRVADADVYFPGPQTRGALTDKGRVYIVLGPPKEYLSTAHRIQDTLIIRSDSGERSADGHEMAARDTFTYPNPHSLGLTEAIVFMEDLRTKEWHYDLQHANVGGALGLAATRSVVNADLKEVPEWATAKAIAASQQRVVIAPAPKLDDAAPPAAAMQPAGVHTLVLLKDAASLDPEGSADPLSTLASVDSFTRQDAVGYATSLCVANYDPEKSPAIKLAVTITGQVGAKKIRMVAPEETYTPDAIRMLPGCYLVSGAVPLADFGAGAYKLSLTLTDPTSQQKYNLEQPFKVE